MTVKIMTPNNSTVNREQVALKSLIINNKKELVTVLPTTHIHLRMTKLCHKPMHISTFLLLM